LFPGPIVAEDSKQKNQREKEERKRMQMYLTIQSQEIKELKAEITVLKRKDLPAFSQSLSLNSLAHCPGKVPFSLSIISYLSFFPLVSCILSFHPFLSSFLQYLLPFSPVLTLSFLLPCSEPILAGLLT
jgi:hypothetical protein